MSELITRASSINRALDEIGDKWCLLILQEVFWGNNTFSGILEETGISRGVLSNRLKWLQEVECLRKRGPERQPTYHLTRKSVGLHQAAMMATAWEDRFFDTRGRSGLQLIHKSCGQRISPKMACGYCREEVDGHDVSYHAGPGSDWDVRAKKVRRRSSLSMDQVPGQRSLYKHLINLVGDRWTANIIALSYGGLHRFEEFHTELPVATNILSHRMRLLVSEGIFETRKYQERPVRYGYYLTEKGWAMFPWFLALLQWGDKWCDPNGAGRPVYLRHKTCNRDLHGVVVCGACGEELLPHEVSFSIQPASAEISRSDRDKNMKAAIA